MRLIVLWTHHLWNQLWSHQRQGLKQQFSSFIRVINSSERIFSEVSQRWVVCGILWQKENPEPPELRSRRASGRWQRMHRPERHRQLTILFECCWKQLRLRWSWLVVSDVVRASLPRWTHHLRIHLFTRCSASALPVRLVTGGKEHCNYWVLELHPQMPTHHPVHLFNGL